MPISSLSVDQISAALGWGGAVERGRAYFKQGRVLAMTQRAVGEGLVIEAEVAGSDSRPYRQTISIAPSSGGRVRIDGECSCPVGWNCKHVAAALLAWREAPPDPFQVPPQLTSWLEMMADAVARSSETWPEGASQRLFYLLDVQRDGLAVVRPMSVKLDRRGEVSGQPRLQDANAAASRTPAKYLRASDLRILSRIVAARRWSAVPEDYALVGAPGAAALMEMAATGRCRWRELSGRPIAPGPALPARIGWRSDDDGVQRLVVEAEAGERLLTLNLSPPHYLDPEAGIVGPLHTGLPDAVASLLAQAPPLPPAIAEEASERLARTLAGSGLQLAAPERPSGYSTVRPSPRPVARIGAAQVQRTRKIEAPSRSGWRGYVYGYGLETAELPVLRLAFDYAGTSFDLGDPVAARASPADRKVRVVRDPAAEKRLVSRLRAAGLKRLDGVRDLHPASDQRAWFTLDARSAPGDFAGFILNERPVLESEGWVVEVDPAFPLRLAEADADGWGFALAPVDAAQDWFDLQLGVRVEGRRVDVLPALLDLLRALPEGGGPDAVRRLVEQRRPRGVLAVPLADGRMLTLPVERVGPILEGLVAVWGPRPEPEETRLSRWQSQELAELQDRSGGVASWSGAARLMELAAELRDWPSRPPTPVPSTFRASLRAYQQAGLDWLQMLGRCGFGGLLADDMGLGKTIQALAHLSVLKAAGDLAAPALVVAPTSVLPNWAAEAGRFAPELRTLVLRGRDRRDDFARIPEHDLVVTSYPLLARDRAALAERDWSVAILDEGQVIRNPATAGAQAAFALKARQRIVLSGTPVENHLGDVWSLMNFLNPGMLGDAKAFARAFRTPIEKQGDAAARARLARRLRPFLLRRAKAEVAGELPPRTEIAETVELTPAQADLYESTRLIMHARVRDALAQKGLARSSVIVLDALLKLRQVCCDPRLVKGARARPDAAASAKLQRLLELVVQLREEGRRALVFSQFTTMLGLIRDEIDALGLEYAWLTGDTADRAEPVRRFQAGEAPLFLISLKAGGFGLNLTAADTVILYDPWWNPAVEAQAIDRAHRIGQTQPVFVHRLIAAGTIEDKMLALQARKRELAAALWDEDAAGLGALTEADVQALFAP